MEAAQTGALALSVGLNLFFPFLLALNVVRHRFNVDSADQVILEKVGHPPSYGSHLFDCRSMSTVKE